MAKIFDENTEILFKGILTLTSVKECEDFFKDLCTVKEIQEMSQRFQVARYLHKGLVYADIAEKTGASTATISRVNRAVNYGEGGYSNVIEKLENEND